LLYKHNEMTDSKRIVTLVKAVLVEIG